MRLAQPTLLLALLAACATPAADGQSTFANPLELDYRFMPTDQVARDAGGRVQR